jgi:hypothetical protein
MSYNIILYLNTLFFNKKVQTILKFTLVITDNGA